MTNSVFFNPLSTAIDISPNQGNVTRPLTESSQVFQSQLDATTTFRDYRFSLSSSTQVSLLLSSNEGNVDLRLYRNLGSNVPLQEIRASTNLGLTPEVIGTELAAGDYYIRLNAAAPTRSIGYTFSFSTAIAATTVPVLPELFWYQNNGVTAHWTMGGDKNLTLQASQGFESISAGWSIAAVGDWNQDGIADLVLRNAAQSATKIWFMGGEGGLVRQSEKTLMSVDASWDVVGNADWNQDGAMDLIWRNNAGGAPVVWLMGGTDKTTIQSSLSLDSVPQEWSIEAIVDFDRNGKQDILWRNKLTGDNVVWFMGGAQGTEVLSRPFLTNVPLDWDIVGAVDWDQDSRPDILWQNSVTGQRVVWFMADEEGLSIREGQLLQTIPPEWIMLPYVAATAPRIPDAIGNSLPKAFNLGTLRSGEFQDWIGGGDRNDIYQFSLSEKTRISINLSQLPAGTEVVFLDANGQQLVPPTPEQGSNTLTEQLEAGQYYIQVKSIDSRTANYTLKLDAFGLETWLGDLGDTALRSEIRSRLADGVLDRTDMIRILQSAGDGNVVDAIEFADLTRLSRNFLDLNADPNARSFDFVSNLLSKVVGSDRANATYKGQALGNLAAGSTKVTLDALIDKWFLGGDRPETSFVYGLANGRLVRSGIDYKDISQGELKDSAFLASLAAAAQTQTQTISQMFIDNRDGTYTIRFFKPDKTADYVTVDRYLPKDPTSGTFAYARQYFTLGAERAIDDPDNELWVGLLEKAYAQWMASGWVTSNPNPGNRYSNLTTVSNTAVMASIFGKAIEQRTIAVNTLESLSNATFAQPLVFVSKSSYTGLRSDVIANHTYTFLQTTTNPTTGEKKYRLYNPWGNLNQFSDKDDPNLNVKAGEIEMTTAEIAANFKELYWVV